MKRSNLDISTGKPDAPPPYAREASDVAADLGSDLSNGLNPASTSQPLP